MFKDASGTLDKGARFSALYRQDSSKLSDEDMFKLLTDFRKYAVSPLLNIPLDLNLNSFGIAFSVCFPNRPEKMAKLPVLLGNLDVTIDSVAPDVTSKPSKYLHRLIIIIRLYPEPCNSSRFLSADCVTSSYVPVRSFEGNGPGSALLEVEEFVPCIAKCSQPFTIYKNHLYVYPKHLKYDGQKSFAKV